ncbi:MAG: hypothetical protein WDO24_25795 [Pseudomonadota bacterium]
MALTTADSAGSGAVRHLPGRKNHKVEFFDLGWLAGRHHDRGTALPLDLGTHAGQVAPLDRAWIGRYGAEWQAGRSTLLKYRNALRATGDVLRIPGDNQGGHVAFVGAE